MTNVTESIRHGFRVLQLENEWFSLSILPEVGARILELFDKRSARSVLWENPRIRPQRFPIDANFDNYWCGGWDDVFPTAGACVHQGEPCPNVGELRSLNWDAEDLSACDSVAVARLSAYGPISYYHAIVESWTGCPVNLEEAFKDGRASQLLPGQKFAVTVRCTTYAAPETHTDALKRRRNK